MIDGDEVELEPVETPEAEPEPIERGASVRDHIERALKEHSTEPEEKPDRKPAREKRETPPKDASGKFTKAAPTEAAPKPDPTPSQPAATEPPTAEAAAPKTWTKEAQAQWAGLPQWARDQISKRENDMARGFELDKQRYGGARKAADELLPIFQRYGRTADQGMEQVSAWFQAIERNPQVAIAELAKQYNVTLSAQPGTAPTSQPGAAPNPTATQVQPNWRQEFQPYAARLDRLENADKERQNQVWNERLNEWAKDKPHFPKVRQAMYQIIAGAIQAQDASILDSVGNVNTDEVYKRAIWQNDEVREQLIKEMEAARRAERQAAADKARKAGSSVRPGAPGSAGPVNGAKQPKKGQSVRESIKDAIEELRS